MTPDNQTRRAALERARLGAQRALCDAAIEWESKGLRGEYRAAARLRFHNAAGEYAWAVREIEKHKRGNRL